MVGHEYERSFPFSVFQTWRIQTSRVQQAVYRCFKELHQNVDHGFFPSLLPIVGVHRSVGRSRSLSSAAYNTYSEARHELSDSDGAPKMGVHRFRRRFGSLFTYVLQIPPPTLHSPHTQRRL